MKIGLWIRWLRELPVRTFLRWAPSTLLADCFTELAHRKSAQAVVMAMVENLPNDALAVGAMTFARRQTSQIIPLGVNGEPSLLLIDIDPSAPPPLHLIPEIGRTLASVGKTE